MSGRPAVAIASLVSLLAAGCGSGGTGSENALPGTEEYLSSPCPEVAVKPSGTEFTYWSMWTKDEPQGKVLQHAFDCFKEKAGVTVNVQWLGRKLLTQNVAPALNTDNVPDLIDQDISQIKAAVVEPGGTQGLDDVLSMKVGEGDRTVADVIPAAYYDIPQNKDKDGKIFVVPYEVLSNAWWYDKDQVTNFTPPKTFDELFAAFDRSKQAGRAAIAHDGDINFYNAYYFTQLATRYVGPGGLVKAAEDRTGELWRTEPGLLKSAQIVERIAKGGYLIDGWDAAKFPQIQQRWADGEADFLFVGSWGPSETREYLTKQGSDKKINYGSFQFPMPEGATYDIVEQLPIGFAVTAKADHAEPAKAFIAYFLNKELLRGIPTVADNITPRPDLDVPDDLKDVKAALDDPQKAHNLFMDGLDGLFGGTYVDNVFYPADNDLLSGKITAQEFVDRMATGTAEYWRVHG
jgi:raffinose/stachyose/melibiose transport system substrate-binding protein